MTGGQKVEGAVGKDGKPTLREAFLRLMAAYHAAIERLASAYVSDPRDREDLVQDIAVALWRALPNFRGESSERTWLYRIAHNTAITASAKLWRRGRTEAELEEISNVLVAGSPSFDDGLDRERAREWLGHEIRQLSPTDRQVLILHLEDLSYREIQMITGISEGAVATRLSRIRGRLAEKAREQGVKRE